MEAYSPLAKLLIGAMDKQWFRSFVPRIERSTIPGIMLHYALRKRYLEEVVRRSLNEGFDQVVVLGAGFDTLSLRLHQEFSEVMFIEIDHPATQQTKKRALEPPGFPKPNMKFLPVDFTCQSLEHSLLTSKDYRPGASTLFIAEGVLMYLRSDEVTTIFRFIHNHGGHKSRVAFTFMSPRADGKVRFRTSSMAVDLWLWLRSETFKWGIEREDLVRYLGSLGFLLQELATSETFRRQYLLGERSARIPLAEGEYVCVADRIGGVIYGAPQ